MMEANKVVLNDHRVNLDFIPMSQQFSPPRMEQSDSCNHLLNWSLIHNNTFPCDENENVVLSGMMNETDERDNDVENNDSRRYNSLSRGCTLSASSDEGIARNLSTTSFDSSSYVMRSYDYMDNVGDDEMVDDVFTCTAEDNPVTLVDVNNNTNNASGTNEWTNDDHKNVLLDASSPFLYPGKGNELHGEQDNIRFDSYINCQQESPATSNTSTTFLSSSHDLPDTKPDFSSHNPTFTTPCLRRKQKVTSTATRSRSRSISRPRSGHSKPSTSIPPSSVSSSRPDDSATSPAPTVNLKDLKPATRNSGSREDVNDSLAVAASRAVQSGRLSPLLKIELKYLIQSRRLSEGKNEMEVSFDPPADQKLSDYELARVERRRHQNRQAAKRFRDKKKTTESSLIQNIKELSQINEHLSQQAKQLREEKQLLMETVADHLLICPCLGQVPLEDVIKDAIP